MNSYEEEKLIQVCARCHTSAEEQFVHQPWCRGVWGNPKPERQIPESVLKTYPFYCEVCKFNSDKPIYYPEQHNHENWLPTQPQPKRAASVDTVEALKYALHLPDDAIVTGMEWDASAEWLEICYLSEVGIRKTEGIDNASPLQLDFKRVGTITLEQMKDYENSQKANV